MTITIQSEGRRHYLVGDTYPIRAAVKAAGCNWDRDRASWWTGKRDVAEALVAKVQAGAVKAVASFAKLPDGSWGVRVSGSPAVGSTLEVEGKYGRKTVTIASIVETRDGSSICSVAAEPRKSGSSSGRRSFSSGRRTGCSCGSREDSSGELIYSERNCSSCNFDAYDC